MQETDIDECFRLLKLRRGADLAAVKQAYRQNLYKCHPDRFQGRPDLLPVAERKTKRLVEVYAVLEKWYAEHGGLDPGSPSGAPGRDPAPAYEPDGDDEEFGEDTRGDRLSRWAKVGGALAAAASFALFVWSFFETPRQVAVPPAPAALGTPAAAAPVGAPVATVPQDPAAERAALVAALTGARAQAKADWIKTYTDTWGRERAAAEGELDQARLEYARDVTGQAARIGDAEGERARLLSLARADSAALKEAFAKRAEADRAALRQAYDQWLLAKGEQAVSLIRRIREREHSNLGVFSTTEDPARIFAFWTADEAGGPEVNIAAKSGIAVRQPDSRYFPNFRSNIYLYEPEGGVLVGMMEEIVQRHDDLHRKIEDDRKSEDAELGDWERLHPLAPKPLAPDLAAVLESRDRAEQHLAEATERVERAAQALADADAAFEQTEKGREFASRIAAARSGGSPLRVPASGSAK